MRKPLVLVLLAAGVLASHAQPPAVVPAETALAAAQESARSALARPDLAAYRGWIKYLLFRAEAAALRPDNSSEILAAAARLENWLERMTADPGLLAGLRGVQEWAYESPVDGSGQPFKLNIPTDYDPARATPITVVMHGYSGNHLEHSAGATDRPGDFELFVLGRARGGWYVALSRADILQALDYVERHWNIDPNRVRLAGGSMGGGATFKLASRYPHRFAAGQITCGYAEQEPAGNLLTFPIYATHSGDDPVVPAMHVRAFLRRLRAGGGQAILDETRGLGHAAWNYAEGNRRSGEWAVRQVRPASTSVRHLDFTALDGDACRAWWAEVAEWGPMPKPARFALTAGADNTLFAELTNVARLRLRLAESPFDRTRPLKVVAGNTLPIEFPAPLPETLVLAWTAPAWTFESDAPAPTIRLHTPGGPIQVYDGSPLLIVHGTGGTAAARAAMRAAAEAASRSPNPGWAAEGGETGADGVPHRHNLYGRLAVKADADVTEDDLQRCNLVLIGQAAENTVVARLESQLPVRFGAGRISCPDGFQLPAARTTLGLVHFNPLAPRNLVFWVASADPAGYAAGATIPELAREWFVGADLVVTDATSGALIATRSFDSRWRWCPGRDQSPLLPETLRSHQDLAVALARAARRLAGADFAVAHWLPALGPVPVAPGVTRAADIASLLYHHPIDVIEVTGADLIAVEAKLAATLPGEDWVRLTPALDPAQVDPARAYRLALPMLAVGPFGRATLLDPPVHERTTLLLDDAVDRFLGRPGDGNAPPPAAP